MSTYAYLRFSTDKQDERQQLNTIQKHLEAKGMRIDKAYIDEGISGGTSYTKRNLFDLCKDIQRGDIVVVSEVSRITRSGIAELSEIIEKHFKPNKLRLIICNEGLDIDCSDINPMTELQLAMLATFAKIEKNLIRERTKSALEVKKKQGVKLGRPKGVACSQSVKEASAARNLAKAKDNDHNVRFYQFVLWYEQEHGQVRTKPEIDGLAQSLCALGYKTAQGMDFDYSRCKAMLNKCRRIFAS